MTFDKACRPTKVFAKAALDIVISAMCKHRQRFGLDVQRSALVLNFNNIFLNGHLLPGWTINEFPAFTNTRTVADTRKWESNIRISDVENSIKLTHKPKTTEVIYD